MGIASVVVWLISLLVLVFGVLILLTGPRRLGLQLLMASILVWMLSVGMCLVAPSNGTGTHERPSLATSDTPAAEDSQPDPRNHPDALTTRTSDGRRLVVVPDSETFTQRHQRYAEVRQYFAIYSGRERIGTIWRRGTALKDIQWGVLDNESRLYGDWPAAATAALKASDRALAPQAIACPVDGARPDHRHRATFSPPGRGLVAMVDVTFRGQLPSAAFAEKVLRTCLQAAIDRYKPESDVLAYAWYSQTGREDDDDYVDMLDGSSGLTFKSTTGQILTNNSLAQ